MKDFLIRNGLSGGIERIAATPYSEVDKITTESGVYYLKKTPPALFIETRILSLLRRIDPSLAVPEVVAEDEEDFRFVMRSCGDETLRSLFSGRADTGLLETAVREYKRIQEASAPRVRDFLGIGVPDWRLSRLPGLYGDFVRDEGTLERWGVGRDDRTELRAMEKIFADACRRAASCGIPDALNHSDFQENNMVIAHATGKISIIDWGEVTIGPALWPVVGFFKKICRRYALSAESPEGQRLLESFMSGEGLGKEDTADAFRSLSLLDCIYYVLSLAALEKNTGTVSAEWSARIKTACDAFIRLAREKTA